MYWSARWKNRTICSFESIMMKRETIPIVDVYVPIKRRSTLEQKRVDEIAASILDKGLLSPILVRDHRRLPCRCREALNGRAPLSRTCRIRGTQAIILTRRNMATRAI